ncbi:hypothetical protein ICN82_09210, partial [Mangrovicoccus sp. HB182678]
MAGRLSIGRLAAEARLVGGGDATALDRRLGAALRDGLPGALGQAVVLPAEGAVLRIRRLRLDVTLAEGFDPAALAHAIAVQLAGALRAAIAQPGTEARIWPDPAAYMAAYAEHRLGLAAAPDWAFPDFAALRHLSGSEAVAELMAVRPGLLPVLAARGEAEGDPARMAARLEEAAALRLVLAWAARTDLPVPDAGLSAAVARAVTSAALADLRTDAPGRSVLALALRATAATGAEA